MVNQLSEIGWVTKRRAAAATIAVLLLPAATLLHARAKQVLNHSPSTQAWQSANVTILARGSNVSDSTGDMDSYLVLLSEHKHREPVLARLVDYRSGIEPGLTDDAILSHPQYRVRVTAADYCAMDASAFVVKRAFDLEAVGRLQGSLACVVVRH